MARPEDFGAVRVSPEDFGAKPIGQDKSPDPGSTFTRGIYKGIGDIAGAPVDMITTALNAVMRGRAGPESAFFTTQPMQIQTPLGGSDWLNAQMRKINLPSGTPLTYPNLEALPQEERSVAVAGEIFGGGLPFAFAPPLAAARGVQGPAMLKPVMDAARNRPGQFLAAEVGGLAGAAQGGALAELVAPGQPLARFGGELAGGFLNPVGLVLRAGGGAVKEVKGMIASLSAEGRASKAAEIIQQALAEAGEDPDKISKLLRSKGLVNFTSGQQTGSPTLLALEAKLAKQSAKFGGESQRRTQDGLKSLRDMAVAMEKSGDPELLKAAARARESYFNGLIESRLKLAQAEATEGAARLSGRSDASKRSAEIIESSLDDARNIESELWGKVDGTLTAVPDNIGKRYTDLRKTLLKEERVDPLIEAVLGRIKGETKDSDIVGPGGVPFKIKTGGAASVQELRRIRTRMLALGREARAKGEFDKSRQYGEIAQGALEDLSTVVGKEADDARSFSKSLHDTFSRTFAGDVTELDASGAKRIHPDLVLERAYGSGGAGAKVRLGEMQSAAEFSGYGSQMRSEQEQFLRHAAKASVDPQTGRVNTRRLEAFIQDNQIILERFPGMRRDLSNASNAEQVFAETERSAKTASTQIKRRAAFSQLLEFEDTSKAISSIFGSKTPEKSYSQLVSIARKAGTGATAGLRVATLDHAARTATDAAGNFSFGKYRQALKTPIGQNGPTPLAMMVKQGVMGRGDEVRLELILKEAEKIQTAIGNKARMNELMDAPDALVDFVTRVAGANLGSMSAVGQASGAPLVAAGAGSKYLRQLFQKVPRTRLQDVLIEASEKPEFMAALLAKPRSEKQAKALERQINAFLIQAGISSQEEQ